MRKGYSTLIIPENSLELLFSVKCDTNLFHCWKNKKRNKFVLIKESNDLRLLVPNQLMNFSEKQLKRYLFLTTNKLRDIDECLFMNESLWKRYFG